MAAATPVLELGEVESTSSEAFARAHAGELGPLWVRAERQTRGRGRRGRFWTSEPGNLHASLLLTDPAPPETCPQLCFVVGVALFDAVVAASGIGRDRLSLKWPNDLLVDGSKCAGILVEGEGASPGRPFTVVVGVGVNCAHHPDGLAYPATDLAAAGAPAAPADVLAALDAALAARRAEWARGAGFEAIRAAWLARAAGLGRRLSVRAGVADLDGVFEDLDATGALLLRTDDGRRHAVAIGDVAGAGLRAETRP